MEFELLGMDEWPPQEVLDFIGDKASMITVWRRVWTHHDETEFTMNSRFPSGLVGPWYGLLSTVTLKRIPNTHPPLFVGVEQPGVGFWATLIPRADNPYDIDEGS